MTGLDLATEKDKMGKRQETNDEKISVPGEASRHVVCSLEPRLIHRLQRRGRKGEVLAVGLRIRDNDGDQAAVDRDDLVHHRRAADADGVARLELRAIASVSGNTDSAAEDTYAHG
jgi:hypothetical protein